jgi:hypothetical protein
LAWCCSSRRILSAARQISGSGSGRMLVNLRKQLAIW